MRGCDTRNILAGSKRCIGVMLLILSLLSLLPTLGETEEDPGRSPKKPRFEVTPQVLQDNVTGLMWTVNADIADRTFSWDGAQDYLIRMNIDRYAGYRNWRMPSLEELETVIAQVRTMGFDGMSPERSVAAGFRQLGVMNMQSDGYWTSTTNMYYSAEAWYVNMTGGSCAVGDKTLYFALWPVRPFR